MTNTPRNYAAAMLLMGLAAGLTTQAHAISDLDWEIYGQARYSKLTTVPDGSGSTDPGIPSFVAIDERNGATLEVSFNSLANLTGGTISGNANVILRTSGTATPITVTAVPVTLGRFKLTESVATRLVNDVTAQEGNAFKSGAITTRTINEQITLNGISGNRATSYSVVLRRTSTTVDGSLFSDSQSYLADTKGNSGLYIATFTVSHNQGGVLYRATGVDHSTRVDNTALDQASFSTSESFPDLTKLALFNGDAVLDFSDTSAAPDTSVGTSSAKITWYNPSAPRRVPGVLAATSSTASGFKGTHNALIKTTFATASSLVADDAFRGLASIREDAGAITTGRTFNAKGAMLYTEKVTVPPAVVTRFLDTDASEAE